MQRQQQLDNPQLVPNGDDKPATCADLSGDDRDTCTSYADGWYTSYVGWVVFESLVPLSKVARAGKVLEKLTPEQIRRYAAAAKSVREQVGAAKQATGVRIADTLATGKAISRTAAQRALREARAVGQQLRRTRLYQRLSPSALRVVTNDSGDLDVSFRRSVDRADSGTTATQAEIDDALQKIEELNSEQQRTAKQFVCDTEVDGQGLKLISEIDEQTLRRLTDIEDSAEFRQALARQNTRGVVDADQIQSATAKIDEIDGVKQTRAKRLIEETSDGAGVQLIDGLKDGTDLRTLLNEDPDSLQTVADWNANPDAYQYIDSDLNAEDFAYVANNGEISETQFVVKLPTMISDGFKKEYTLPSHQTSRAADLDILKKGTSTKNKLTAKQVRQSG